MMASGVNRRAVGPTKEVWNANKDNIVQLYVIEKNTLDTVRACMARDHGFSAKPEMYKKMFQKWGIRRNLSRSQVMAALRQQEETKNDSIPDNISKYARRNKMVYAPRPFWPQGARISATVSYTALEKVKSDVHLFATSSYQLGTWQSHDPEYLLNSSRVQEWEREALHAFISAIDIGCREFKTGNRDVASSYWRGACQKVEVLVHGTYHDNLPNIVQKLNDIADDGFFDLATQLKACIAACTARGFFHNRHQKSMYENVALLDREDNVQLEAHLMPFFVDTFGSLFGLDSYSTCVMRNNQNRRRLRHDRTLNASTIQQHMSNLFPTMEAKYGPCNKRTLDSLTMCTELLSSRMTMASQEQHQQQETQDQSCTNQSLSETLLDYANMLIVRSQNTNEQWAHLYFSIHGHYFHGTATHQKNNNNSTNHHFKRCIEMIDEFATIDSTPIFDPERLRICEILENIALEELSISNFNVHAMDLNWLTPDYDDHGTGVGTGFVINENEREVHRWRWEREMTLKRMCDNDEVLRSLGH